jgi:hypothetical protein
MLWDMSKMPKMPLRTLTVEDLKRVTGGSPTLPLPPPSTTVLGAGGNGGDVGGA